MNTCKLNDNNCKSAMCEGFMNMDMKTTKLFTKEYDIGMRICLLLLGMVLFTTVTVSMLFLFNLSVGVYSFPLSISLLVLVYTLLFYDKNDRKRFFIPLIVSFLLGASAIIVSSYIWDTSWDGWLYHIPATIDMAEGWNPVYEHSDAVNIYEPYAQEQEHMLWVQHYPKFIWIYGAALYKFTGLLFSGSSITLIFIICTFLITVDVFKHNKNTPRSLVYFIGLVVSLNVIIITQLFTFYNDGLLGNAIVCLILILYSLGKGYYSYKGNFCVVFLVAFFVSFLVNIKLTGALYAAVIMVMFFLYLMIKKIIMRKDKFTPYFAGIVLLITLIVGSNSYLINLVYHRNIGYPIIGKEKVDIILNNTPYILQFDGKYAAFVESLTSDTHHGFDRMEYIYKPAFIISHDEVIAIASTTDPRLAGFGPAYQLVLWAFLLIIFALFVRGVIKRLTDDNSSEKPRINYRQKRKKENKLKTYSNELMVLLVYVVLIMITPNIWWARYLPFFYTLPALCFVMFNTDWQKVSLVNMLGSFMIVLYIICAVVYTGYSVKYSIASSNACRRDLQYYKEQSQVDPINIAFYNYNLFLYKIPVVTHMFENNGVAYNMYSEDESVVSGYRSFTLGIDIVEPLSPKNIEIAAGLRQAKDAVEYFGILEEYGEDFLIIVTAKDDASIYIDYIGASTLGISDIYSLSYQESYIGVIDEVNGFIYENISYEKQTFVYRDEIEIVSAGFPSGNESQVLFKGAQYSKNERGLNVCVFDTITLKIIDSVHIDTYGDIDVGIRRW